MVVVGLLMMLMRVVVVSRAALVIFAGSGRWWRSLPQLLWGSLAVVSWGNGAELVCVPRGSSHWGQGCLVLPLVLAPRSFLQQRGCLGQYCAPALVRTALV